jgi:hypothetical protein
MRDAAARLEENATLKALLLAAEALSRNPPPKAVWSS